MKFQDSMMSIESCAQLSQEEKERGAVIMRSFNELMRMPMQMPMKEENERWDSKVIS
jgi:hypothetical protein